MFEPLTVLVVVGFHHSCCLSFRVIRAELSRGKLSTFSCFFIFFITNGLMIKCKLSHTCALQRCEDLSGIVVL